MRDRGFSSRVIAALAVLTVSWPAAAQDNGVGKGDFGACLACHVAGPDGKHRTGPNLNGIVGRPAGSAAGFEYSSAMTEAGAAGLVWSEETLDKYLADPAGFIPNSKMAWAVDDPAARAALIAHLKTLK
jgi:cytochrome c